jgi:putative redox protein
MVNINTIYLGELRTCSTHMRSGIEIFTDAPEDNHGKGQAFSPTDLVALALGTCMITTIAIRLNNLDLHGTRIKISKIMTNQPRRISEIVLEFDFTNKKYSDVHKSNIEEAALNCPVAKSLNCNIKQTVHFSY